MLSWPQAIAQTQEALSWYTQGVQALEQRRFADARAAFLQAIAADPSFAGAWLDLALAAHGEGDTVQAEEFLTILEARFTLPPAIASAVHALRQRIQESRLAAGTEWRWRRVLQAGVGHDSNANAGLALKDLTLTLPGGDLPLPVAPSMQPQADRYALTSIAADGWRNFGAGELGFSASGKARVNASLNEFDTVELQAGLAYANAEPPFAGALRHVLPGPWRVGISTQHLRFGGNGLLSSMSFSAQHAWKQAACSPQAGVELDVRHFPIASNLDSRVLWLSTAASCGHDWLGAGSRLGVQFRYGWEKARGNFLSNRGRPGGDTRHHEFTLSQRWSWAGFNGANLLEAQAQWAGARDTEGYSPLLSDNARRRLTRATAAIAFTMPLTPAGADPDAWLGTLSLQGFRQRSNLEVFRLKGAVLQFTAQKNW